MVSTLKLILECVLNQKSFSSKQHIVMLLTETTEGVLVTLCLGTQYM